MNGVFQTHNYGLVKGYLIFLMYYLKCAFGYRNLEHVNMFSSNTQGMKPRLLVLLVARFRSVLFRSEARNQLFSISQNEPE